MKNLPRKSMTRSMITTTKWLNEFNRANTLEEIGTDPDFQQLTEPELLELFASWLNIQLDSLFSRAVLASSCLPDLEGGIAVLFERSEKQMFPTLVIDVYKDGYVNVARLGEHADTVVQTTINNLEENPAIALLVEEFL